MRVLKWVGLAGVISLTALAEPETPVSVRNLTGAQWLWCAGVPKEQLAKQLVPAETVEFRREILLPKNRTVLKAWFAGTADDVLTLTVNGQKLISSSVWTELSVAEFQDLLKPGKNMVQAQVCNSGSSPNAGGFVGRLQIDFSDGDSLVLLTDETWQASRRGNVWSKPTVLGDMGIMPWGLLGSSKRTLPENFTRFAVPGAAAEMESLRNLFFEYYNFFPYATLWDPWTPMSMLWPDAQGDQMQKSFRALLGGRFLTEDGYVSTHQHRGMAHDLGWPFPLWTQIAGWGWQFSGSNNPFGSPLYGMHTHHSMEGFVISGLSEVTYDHEQGLHANISRDATLQTPACRVNAVSAPFFRMEWWAEGMEKAEPYLEWTTEKEPEFSEERRVYFEPAQSMEKQLISMIPLYKVVPEDAVLTGFRIGFGNKKSAKITVQALMTAADSRHTINNSIWVNGCADYLRLTGDTDFMKEQIGRMRKSIRYAMSEFQTKEKKCIYTSWRGHDGRSGIIYKGKKKIIRPGFGVGNNYWDLLPFGGHDFLSTIYFYDALNDLAEMEEAVQQHPKWGIQADFDPAELRAHAAEIRTFCQKFFWNEKTGRFFGAVDVDGVGHDYGFTFVNLEAIAYGIATPEQAVQIMDWISGKRLVKGDTSQGADIYRWRFAARATTLRNIDYYSSVWPAPETIPFGGQVQDGGAVLGFSYFDLMSRLKVYGPDNAAQRLKEIVQWYDEVQAEGGVRAYYAKPGRGSLQGGGTAGGLGIDQEFMESVLLPQVMLYGFMGFEPKMDGFALNPKLPSTWPSLQITDVHFQDRVYDLSTDGKTVDIVMKSGEPVELTVHTSQLNKLKMKTGQTQTMKAGK